MKYDRDLELEAQAARGRHLSETYQTFYHPWIVFSLLLVSWWTSFTGVLSMGDWISGTSETTVSVGLLVTGAAMIAQFALWHFALRLIPYYGTMGARSIGIVVMLILMWLLAFSSTFTSFVGLIQDSAHGLEAQGITDTYAEKARQLEARAAATEDALLPIRLQAVAACQRYEEELATGAITGSRGRGIFTGQLLALCTSKREMATILEDTIAANAERVLRINSLSEALDDILFRREQEIGDREQAILRGTRQIDIELRGLQNSDRSRGLRAAFAAISNSIAEMEGATGALAQAQAQVIAALITEERANAAALDALLDQIEAIPLPDATRAQLLPAQELVIKHWDRHLPQLALALACDMFAPLSALLFWAAAMRVRRRFPQPPT